MKVDTTSCGCVRVTSGALWSGVQVRETAELYAKVTQGQQTRLL